jgi:hypothetical protein
MERVAIRLETLDQVGRPLRLSELAGAIGCSRWYLRKCIAAGTLEAGHIGRDLAISLTEAHRFVRDELKLIK